MTTLFILNEKCLSASGLRKAKKYDWKDSNLALFGSDLERQVKSEYIIYIHSVSLCGYYDNESLLSLI